MKRNESGRSMVEMLGVLAIIGVLSVGGIAGYTLAMEKYREGELTNLISMTHVEAVTSNAAVNYTEVYDDIPDSLSAFVSQVQVSPQGDVTVTPAAGGCPFCNGVVTTMEDVFGFSDGDGDGEGKGNEGAGE